MFLTREISAKQVLNNGFIPSSAIAVEPNVQSVPVHRRFFPYPVGSKLTIEGDREGVLKDVIVKDSGIVGIAEVDEETYEVNLPNVDTGLTQGVYFGILRRNVFIPLAKLNLSEGNYVNLRTGNTFRLNCMNKYIEKRPHLTRADYAFMYKFSEIEVELMREFVRKGDSVVVNHEDKEVSAIFDSYDKNRVNVIIDNNVVNLPKFAIVGAEPKQD